MNVKKIKNIGILGLAYKEGTNSIKNSPAVRFLKRLKQQDIKFIFMILWLKKFMVIQTGISVKRKLMY